MKFAIKYRATHTHEHGADEGSESRARNIRTEHLFLRYKVETTQ